MGALADAVITISKTFDVASPDTLVSGLLTINVKHSEITDGVGYETDCNLAYASAWGNDPNSVNLPSGNHPYYVDAGGTNPPKYPNAGVFDNIAPDDDDGRYYKRANDTDPGGHTASPVHTNIPKELSVGDYDCYLFYVTCCAHLEAPVPYWVGTNLKYHHEACQSFIKSHLISRINNGSDNDIDGATSSYSMFKTGQYRRNDTLTGDGVLQQAVTSGTDYLFSNGDYVDQMTLDGVADTRLPAFGINLGDGNNTFFPPVESIQIGISHLPPDPDAGTGHSVTSYGLMARVHLWALDTNPDFAYFRNRVNVLWQPFGEDAGFEDP